MARRKTRIYPDGFYVYVHKKNSDGSVFYVGKGSGKRAWDWSKRTDLWKNLRRKHGITVEILKEGMSEPCSLTLERILIAKYRSKKQAQANLTDGGEGTSGIKFSDDVKSRMSENQRNRYENEYERIKTSKAAGGRAIVCSNGKEFPTGAHAFQWLTSNGVRCSGSNSILKCAHGSSFSAYGFSWWFKGDPPKEYVHPKERSRSSTVRMVFCENGMSFPSPNDAIIWLKSCGVEAKAPSAILHACRGVSKSSYGYKWSHERFDHSDVKI